METLSTKGAWLNGGRKRHLGLRPVQLVLKWRACTAAELRQAREDAEADGAA